MPWLTASAYIHSVMVQGRRGMLRVWNLSLLCSTFSLTILGTFLTRSGVVESVHAFSESDIGAWLLTFFAIIVAVSVGLIMWRGDRLRSPGRIDSPLSREGAFLANNLLFGLFAFICVLGVTFPLIVSAFGGGEISVGEPFFDRMAGPIGLALLFLMGVAPVLPWRRANIETLRQRLWWPAWCGVAALVLAVAVGATGVLSLLAFAFGGFAAGSAFRQLGLATRRQGIGGLLGRANGGMVVHLGVIMLAVGIVASQSYPHEGEFDLKVGKSAEVAGHTLTYLSSTVAETPTHHELIARVRVDGGQVFAPRINQYTETGQDIGTPSVDIGLTHDVYLSLQRAATSSNDSIGLRVVVQPLIEWLWAGGLIMVIGIAMAAFPGRRRDPLDPVSRPVGSARMGDPEPDSPMDGVMEIDSDSDPDEERVPIS
jgi:cytochrome c-type biogenesis protein CcmF